MEFSFTYQIKPVNLWILSMMNIYRSFTGVVNVIFTASMILVSVRFWGGSGPVIRVLIALGICLFPLIHPLLVLLRCRKITGKMPQDMRMDFTGKELIVTSGNKNSHVDYWEIKSVLRIMGMIIIYTRKNMGFILNREVLQDKGKKLYEFLSKQIK